MRKKAPKKPATSSEVTNTLDAVRAAEISLREAKATLKEKEAAFKAAQAAFEAARTSLDEAREVVYSKRAELKHRKHISKKAFKSALNGKPIR